MSGESERKTEKEALRQAVERRIAATSSPGGDAEDADPRRLLHELRVHQIELEMQNDALQDARLEAESTLALYLRLYEYAPVAYVTLGDDGSILKVNRAALTLLRLTSLPAHPLRLDAMAAAPSLPDVSGFVEHILAGAAVSGVEATLRASADGTEKTVILEGLPDPQGSGGLVALIDVTELKQTQEALRRAKGEAERASAAKTRFLGAVSHDLRQPLQTMYLVNAVLERHAVDAKSHELIAGLERALESMTGVLDVLLDINEIESGFVQPKPRTFCLEPLLDLLTREFAGPAQAKGLRLRHGPCRQFVYTDERLLTQVLRNLLSNAIKYTTRGGILLGVRRAGDRLRIEVCDTGIGIPEDKLEVIFEEFNQINNPSRDRSQGLGLGLAIVRRQAELLHHPFGVRSRLGRGSVFWIEVPRAEREGEEERDKAEPAVPRRNSLRQRTVLVVEDNPAIAALLEGVLSAEGATVISAPDGETALARAVAATEAPDLVVTDYTLPNGMTGLEVVEALRTALSRPVPAILLTGDVSWGTAQAASEQNRCIRLTKPVTVQALLAAIPTLPPPGPATTEKAAPAGPTVFVVDDDPTVREAMADLFSICGWPVEGYADAESFLASVPPDRPGCVLVDAMMPGMGGLELLRRLHLRERRLATIVMTGHGDVGMAVAAMKAGAADFVAKPADPDELRGLVAHALHQDAETDPDCLRRCEAIRRIAGLTSREHQVLDLLLAGHSNKMVAHLLTISQRTVENHRATIMHKTSSKTLLDLFRTVLDAGACPSAIAPLPREREPAQR
ncbi:MAG: hypothetical protein RLZZ501_811 [Pseudomonadota bacterium]|jgi:two-component system CheB/CheR fusion protein